MTDQSERVSDHIRIIEENNTGRTIVSTLDGPGAFYQNRRIGTVNDAYRLMVQGYIRDNFNESNTTTSTDLANQPNGRLNALVAAINTAQERSRYNVPTPQAETVPITAIMNQGIYVEDDGLEFDDTENDEDDEDPF